MGISKWDDQANAIQVLQGLKDPSLFGVAWYNYINTHLGTTHHGDLEFAKLFTIICPPASTLSIPMSP